MPDIDYSYTGGKIVKRASIVDAIKESQKEIRLLGTVAFNIPWNEDNLLNTIIRKFKMENSQYEISVVSESDPSLHSYALASGLENSGPGIAIATLEEIRQNSTQRLREEFLRSGARGLEPVEDVYREQLDSMYSKRFAYNIFIELFVRNHPYGKFFGNIEYEQENCILGAFHKMCVQNAEMAFRNSDLVKYYINEGDYFNLGRSAGAFKHNVEQLLRTKFINVIDSAPEKKVETLFAICDKGIKYVFCDDKSKIKCVWSIKSKELMNHCVDCFLQILSELEQDNFELIKEFASKEAYKERMNLQLEYERDSNKKQRLFIKQIFQPIPLQMLMVDGVYYASLSPLVKPDNDLFLYVGDSTKTRDEDSDRLSSFDDLVLYFGSFVSSLYCTELTRKNNRTEVIYNYTSKHEIIGQMPRDSFYGSNNYKLVMWALVFDRKGRILIHRRANNAKDNQGLWDKSAGGHIAIEDRDTIAGAAREIAEELYRVEEEEQSYTTTNWFNYVNPDEIIYLGKWKETRYPNFGSSLKIEPNEFYLFSFVSRMTAQPIESMRILPNGTRIKARCFVDLYFSITSKNFNLNELKNSKYLVLPPELIKKCAMKKQLTQEMRQEIQKIQSPEDRVSDPGITSGTAQG